MKIWAFCVFMPQKLQDMSSFLGFGGNSALLHKIKGQAFNIGGTMAQSLSLLELFDMLNKILGIKLDYTELPPRQSDQKVFVADITKIKNAIGWNLKYLLMKV